MNSLSAHPHEPAEKEIQHAAYYLWEERGRPAGRDLEIWFAARERLRHQSHVHGSGRPGAPASRGAARVSVAGGTHLTRPSRT